METVVAWVRYCSAAVLAFWAAIPELTQLLMALMVIDMILGIAIAVRQKDFSPTQAWDGVTRKLGSLLIIGVAALMDPYAKRIMEVNLVQAASAFYMVPELGSIIRNAAILDVPVPPQFKSITQYFRSLSGEEPKDK